MKWLHLSDLHFNPIKDGSESIYLRDRLFEFLKNNNVVVDKMFLTGDYRDASNQEDTDENAKEAAKYIMDIAECVKIYDVNDILMVPGNHDLNRNYEGRQECIVENKFKYKVECGDLINKHLLINSFEFYKRIVKNIYGEKESEEQFENVFKVNPHMYKIYNGYNVLMLNTELLAGEIITKSTDKKTVNDEGSLLVGNREVTNALIHLRDTKNPTIVLAHRGLDLLNAIERRRILSLFEDYNVCLYLCGHSHDLWYDETLGIPQVTVGCIKKTEGVKVGFSIGEFDQERNLISMRAYSWDNNSWDEHKHFSKMGSKVVVDISDKTCIKSDDFNNTIKIVIDGIVRSFKCKVDEMTFDVENSSFMSIGVGNLKCVIMNNKYSSNIDYNNRFILSRAVWKIIGIDNTTEGIIRLTCKKELKGSDDDYESGIANKNLISNYYIELLASIIKIGINQEIPLNCMLFRDSEVVENSKICCTTSDENIIVIKNGVLIGKTIGTVDIKMWWQDNVDIFKIIKINVCKDSYENISYRLYKNRIEDNTKSYKNFNILCLYENEVIYGIDKFVNGQIVNFDELFEFNIETFTKENHLQIIERKNDQVKVNASKTETGTTYILNAKNQNNDVSLSEKIDIERLF